MKKTVVIHHSADFDGLFSREVARHFLGNEGVEYIGWDFSDPSLDYPVDAETVYVIDLPVLRQLFKIFPADHSNLVWIDHHSSSIKDHEAAGMSIAGYRIDGVAACRLAWQFFSMGSYKTKEEFVSRQVEEPMAVTLAGEYDVWDHRDGDLDVAFQYGLRAQDVIDWSALLQLKGTTWQRYAEEGKLIKRYSLKTAAEVAKQNAFELRFEGLNFIALNTQARNSFAIDSMATDKHDGLLTFSWTGKIWRVSMYGNGKDIDLSEVAKKWHGGGHKNACGFQAKWLPWLPA